MFEVGKMYEIRMIIDGEETRMWNVIERYEHPLVKFADVHGDKDSPFLKEGVTIHGAIVNVTSPNFISAVIHSPQRD